MIQLYDSNQELFNGNPLRTIHNGKTGGAFEAKLFLRNTDSTTYYTDIVVQYQDGNQDDYGQFGSTGWSVKFLSGSRQPTEEEWDSINPGESITIDDIGSTYAANTFTYFPFWVRVYCPGNTTAQIRELQKILIFYNEHKVGA